MVLKKMAEIVTLPLKVMFNRSMLSNNLPLEWKSLYISPQIFKKGSKSALGYCKPVSLPAVSSKIMQSIIRDKMLKFAQENSFMTSDQHGFMKSRYCLTNVLETLEDWTWDNGCGIGVNLFRLSKGI